MKITKVYTRTGDQGMTSLVGGVRIKKSDIRLEAYGTVDELSAHLGMLVAMMPEGDEHDLVVRVQNNLFNVCTHLATDQTQTPLYPSAHLAEGEIEMLEKRIDELMRQLPELTPESIGQCCDQGDRLALEVYRQAGEMFGIGLSFYASIVNPEAIILTGGLTKELKWLEEPTQLSFNEHLFPNLRGKVELQVSIITDAERDVMGASALAWEVEEYSLFI